MRKAFLFYRQHTVVRKVRTVARVARRKHAVEHIDTGGDRFEYVFGRTDSHNVFRFRFG